MSLGAVQLCGWHQLQARRTDISRGIAKIDRDLVCRVSCNARRGPLRDRRLLITAQLESIHVARAAREVAHLDATHVPASVRIRTVGRDTKAREVAEAGTREPEDGE